MKRLLWFVALAALAVVPCAAQAQSSPSMVGVGAHGYDFLIGTWTCKSNTPSPLGGPSTSTLTGSRSDAGGLFLRSTGKGFDEAGYIAYAAKSKTWWNPNGFSDGGYSEESSTQTGKKTVWTGSYYSAASGKTVQIRDTYTISTMNQFTDLNEVQSAGAWKTQYTITCTKS